MLFWSLLLKNRLGGQLGLALTRFLIKVMWWAGVVWRSARVHAINLTLLLRCSMWMQSGRAISPVAIFAFKEAPKPQSQANLTKTNSFSRQPPINKKTYQIRLDYGPITQQTVGLYYRFAIQSVIKGGWATLSQVLCFFLLAVRAAWQGVASSLWKRRSPAGPAGKGRSK